MRNATRACARSAGPMASDASGVNPNGAKRRADQSVHYAQTLGRGQYRALRTPWRFDNNYGSDPASRGRSQATARTVRDPFQRVTERNRRIPKATSGVAEWRAARNYRSSIEASIAKPEGLHG